MLFVGEQGFPTLLSAFVITDICLACIHGKAISLIRSTPHAFFRKSACIAIIAEATVS
jgi:hypothetical protein